jgi:hypothetical protein
VAHRHIRYDAFGRNAAAHGWQSLVIRSVKFDTEIPDSLFRFELPPGATQVAEFGPPLPVSNLTGKPAPPLTVETLDGGRFDLARFGAKSSCSTSGRHGANRRNEMKELDSVYREFSDGLIVVGLSVGEARETAAVSRLMPSPTQ